MIWIIKFNTRKKFIVARGPTTQGIPLSPIIRTGPLIRISPPPWAIPAEPPFLTDRGQQAFEHSLEIAKARLAARSRAAHVSFSGPWGPLCELTLDHTVFLKDSRLPGGQAKGKVIELQMSASGETGERQVTATLGVSVGTGEMDSAEGPSDDSLVQSGPFVEADYVEKAYAADPGLQWLEVCCIGPMTPKFPKIKGPGTLNGTIIP